MPGPGSVTRMTHDEYVAVLRTEAGAFTTAAGVIPLDGRVPSCPDWTAYDLVAHLGRHYRWVAANLDRAPSDGPAPPRELESPPVGAAAIDWTGGAAEALARRLEAVDVTAPCWTWVEDQTAGFWARRTALETAVHRWDLEAVAGEPRPLAPEVAADAIDEFLSILPFRGGDADPGGTNTIHLHSTDTDGEWLLRIDDGGMRVTREHAKGDVAVRGPAADLLLVVLGRRPATAVECFGDESRFTRWQESSRF